MEIRKLQGVNSCFFSASLLESDGNEDSNQAPVGWTFYDKVVVCIPFLYLICSLLFLYSVFCKSLTKNFVMKKTFVCVCKKFIVYVGDNINIIKD